MAMDPHKAAIAFFDDAHALNVEAMSHVISQTRRVSPKLAVVLQQLDDAWSHKLLRRAMGKYKMQSSQTARIKDDIARLSDGCIGAFGEANQALLAVSQRVTAQRSALTGHKARARALEKQMTALELENERLETLVAGMDARKRGATRDRPPADGEDAEHDASQAHGEIALQEHEAVLERIHLTMDATFGKLAAGTAQRRKLLKKVRSLAGSACSGRAAAAGGITRSIGGADLAAVLPRLPLMMLKLRAELLLPHLCSTVVLANFLHLLLPLYVAIDRWVVGS